MSQLTSEAGTGPQEETPRTVEPGRSGAVVAINHTSYVDWAAGTDFGRGGSD
ncbi:MAG: hypothetical protein V3U55_04225 [Mycobacterium sp.]